MSTAAGAVGYAPTVKVAPIERVKYESMWDRPEYREVAPGESIAPIFLAIAQPKPGSTVIDFGTGTGRGAMMMALMGGCKVEMLDFAENCLDPEVRQALTTQAHALKFTQHDLTKPSPVAAEYGYCTDVMEHIPPEQVDLVLHNILKGAQHVFFQIACEEDRLGALIGQKLHLTVENYTWWLQKLQAFDCVVHWSKDCGSHCLFYVTAWQEGQALIDAGVLNVEHEQVRAQVKANIAAGWNHVQPHETNDQEVMIIGGGPSLAGQEGEVRRLRAEGVKLITLNGAYNWCLEKGIPVSATVVVDAREFNARFTKPVAENCKYLISSQCHPAVLEGLPKDRTLLWHTSAEAIKDILQEQCPTWFGIPGGSTVLLRAIPLLRMLGFCKFHLFGCDSCLDGGHHAYAQPENDGAPVIDVVVGGRTFKCHPWMASQATEFIDLIKVFGDVIEIDIHGDGLLSHILTHGAQQFDAASFLQ